jgi:hypothetical protein
MRTTIWFSKESEIFAEWLIAHTRLSSLTDLTLAPLAMSDGSSSRDFHSMPARIKEILYLDSPDIIISIGQTPLISIEVSEEAGTGHNAFQRFSRLAAAVENGVAAFYLYPQAAWISRDGAKSRWDVINPLIHKTLEHVMRIYDVPAFLYYFPTEFSGSTSTPPTEASGPKGHLYDPNPMYPGAPDPSDSQVREMFSHLNDILVIAESKAASEVGSFALRKTWGQAKRDWMLAEWTAREAGKTWSPITSTVEVDTSSLLSYLGRYAEPSHDFGDMLSSRPKTLVYFATGKYRTQGDPYTGALAAIDYLMCREGKTYEDRSMNLVMAFGEPYVEDGVFLGLSGVTTVDDYIGPIQDLYKSPTKVLLSLPFSKLIGKIPRYMMQVRHGTTYTKRKDLRIYAYFADALLFPDGALWREA